MPAVEEVTMMRVVLIALAAVVAATFAGAEESRFSGKYELTQPRHSMKTKKAPTLTSKQKGTQQYNPKELTVDQKAQWKKAP
jgi:hypothetical protein